MISSTLTSFLICVSFFAVIGMGNSDISKCGVNQVYRDCQIPCLPSCSNLNPPQCEPAECVPGCQCDWNYVSDGHGKCILPTECPEAPTCKENEVSSSCVKLCPATCERPQEMCCKPLRCELGCDCEIGYLRNKDYKCVLPEDCDK